MHTQAPPTEYYTRLAAAYMRGNNVPHTPADAELFSAPLDTLTPEQQQRLIALARQAELRIHRFKHTITLPRVAKVLGALKGIGPSELLDIGSGRGAFLWPLLDNFPHQPVTAIDTLDYRVAGLLAVRNGGVTTLTAQLADATALPFAERSYDVVTMLEVLEHIPDTQRALAEVVRVAQRFVLLSVPSKPDTNPEHIHLFDANTLERLLLAAGAQRVRFDHVPGHLLAIASIET